MEETNALPYEIPDCSSYSILCNLYYFPDKGIQDYFLYKPSDKIMISVIFPIILVVGVINNAGVKKYRVPKIERPSAHRTLC